MIREAAMIRVAARMLLVGGVSARGGGSSACDGAAEGSALGGEVGGSGGAGTVEARTIDRRSCAISVSTGSEVGSTAAASGGDLSRVPEENHPQSLKSSSQYDANGDASPRPHEPCREEPPGLTLAPP